MSPAAGKLFYGWKIVAALFVMLTFSSGLGFYNHSIVIQALARESDFPLAIASLAVSFFFLVSGVSSLFLAPLIEKHDIRWVVGAGSLLMVVSLALLGEIETTSGLFLVYILYGVGFSAGGLLPATTLVARWFETSRAKALSIASTGLSFGGILLTPVSAWLVEHYSMSLAFRWLALVYFLAVFPVCMWVLRSWPSDMGLQRMGQAGALDAPPAGISFRDAIRQHFFWSLSFCYVLTMAAQVGGISHQYGVLSERLDAYQASIGIAVLPAFSVIGRLAGGLLLGRFSILPFTVTMMLLQGVSLLVIALSREVAGLYLGLAMFGASVGNLLMLQPLIVAEVYGLSHYARIYSWSNMITVCGVSSGPVLMGLLSSLNCRQRRPRR